MPLEYDDSHGDVRATDVEYPGIIGFGRTEKGAAADWANRIRTTWHYRRIAECQAAIDAMLSHADEEGMATKQQVVELQMMMDDFVGYLRRDRLME